MIHKIGDILKQKREKREAVFSFEVFPPKTPGGTRSLFNAVAELSALAPDYISVTYGAGGSTAAPTLDFSQFYLFRRAPLRNVCMRNQILVPCL